MLKGTIPITQVRSDLVEMTNNRQLTAKNIRKSIIASIKTGTELTAFLGSCKPGSKPVRRKNIAMSLPKDLYSLAKDVPIPSQ